MKFEKNAYIHVIFFSIISIIYSIISSEIIEYLKVASKVKFIQFKNLMQEILLSLIFAPIIETLFFQFTVYYFIYYIKKKVPNFTLKKNTFLLLYVITSGLLFSISHSYSFYYILLMFIPGGILAYSFYFFKTKFTYPIFYTFLIHFLHNLFAFTWNRM